MTTLQKIFIAAAVAGVTGAGIYEANQVSLLQEQNQALQEQQSSLPAQYQQMRRERDDATNRLSAVNAEMAQLKSGQ